MDESTTVYADFADTYNFLTGHRWPCPKYYSVQNLRCTCTLDN